MISLSRTSVLLIGCLAGTPAAWGETTTFNYDALGRLLQAQVSGGVMSGVQQSFQYDAAGNRTQLQTAGVTSTGATTITPSNTTLNVMGAGDVVLSATVGNTSASGTVSFSFNDVFVGSAAVINGVVHIGFQGIAPGTYTVRAIYTGDAGHAPTTSIFIVKVQDLAWLPAVLDLILNN